MRITIVNQFYAPDISPTAQLAASLAEHRSALGDEVTVVASRAKYAGNDRAMEGDFSEVRILGIWTPGLGKSSVFRRCADYGAFYLGAMFRVCFQRRQDVVICLTTPPFVVVAGLLHKLVFGRPVVLLWNMDCYPELAERSGKLRVGGLVSRFLRSVNRWIFRRVDAVVCLDDAMRSLLVRQYVVGGRQLMIRVIPNWESEAQFHGWREVRPWSGMAELGIEKKFVVLYLGNMGYGHAFDTVLDAAEILRGTDIAFLFVGGGVRQASLVEEATKRELGNVFTRGYVDEKSETLEIMRSSGCALITLKDEILGVMSPSKVHSNLGMGLPILYVGPKGGNVDDLIGQHQCGVSVRHGEARVLADAVLSWASGGSKRDEASRRSRKAFESAYNDRVCLSAFDRLLSDLTERRGGVCDGAKPVGDLAAEDTDG